MKSALYLAASAALVLSGCGKTTETKTQSGGGNRAQVWAAGSSTVFPFATRVAENVARSTGGKPARVESLGTGGGFKLFCGGTSAQYPDVATASRPSRCDRLSRPRSTTAAPPRPEPNSRRCACPSRNWPKRDEGRFETVPMFTCHRSTREAPSYTPTVSTPPADSWRGLPGLAGRQPRRAPA